MAKKLKPIIVEIKILGYDSDNREYDLTSVMTDNTDQLLSEDIETWRNSPLNHQMILTMIDRDEYIYK